MGIYFDTGFEQDSIDTGIARQQQETGVNVQWYFWDPQASKIDDIYDEAVPGAGLHWNGPYPMPVLQASRDQGALTQVDGGSYVVDSITLVLGYGQATAAGMLPRVDWTREHVKDRFVFERKVWSPSSVVARNLLGGRGRRSVILVTATEVRDDELVNDPQFQKYAEHDYADPGPGGVPESDYDEYGESTEPHREP